MKLHVVKILVNVALLFLSNPSSAFEYGTPLVSTTYFYWYDSQANEHMFNADGSDFLTTHPVQLDAISYRSVNWHETQLRDMTEAGIDIVLPVYWGSPALRGEDQFSIDGLSFLARAWQNLENQKKQPPKIGMFYDTTTLWANAANLHVDLRTEEGKRWLYESVALFFKHVPRHQWATIDGKPIVYFYTLQFAKDFDASSFAYLREAFKVNFGTDLFLINNDRVVLENGWKSPHGINLIEAIRNGRAPLEFRRHLEQQVAKYSSSEHFRNIGGTSDALVNDLYQNVLLRCPESSGLRYWLGLSQQLSREALVRKFFSSREPQYMESSRYLRSLHGEPSAGRADLHYSWGGAFCALTSGVAAVGPGFDNKAINWQPRILVDRRNGEHYRESWERLLSMPARARPWLLHIETWNEYHEGSDISDSREYGRTYIDLTKGFSRRFRNRSH